MRRGTVHDGSCATRVGAGASISTVPVRRFSTWVQAVGLVAVTLLLLAGCGDGDGGRGHEDDFLVSFPSPLEISIRRPFDRPFDVVEIGVTPFVTPGIGAEPYVLGLNIAKVSYGATWHQHCRKGLFSDKLQRHIVAFTRVEETIAR